MEKLAKKKAQKIAVVVMGRVDLTKPARSFKWWEEGEISFKT